MLKISCEYLIVKEEEHISPEDLFSPESTFRISKNEVLDAIEILESLHFLKVSRYMGGGKENWGCHYRVSHFGLETYARAYLSNYPQIFERIVSLIVNENKTSNTKIKETTGESRVLIDHVLNELEMNNHVKLSKSSGYSTSIYHVSASLRRL